MRMPLQEALPVGGAVEIVHHQEAALQQIIAQALGLLLGEGPGLDLDGVDQRIVEDVVAVEVDDLLVASGVDARQAPERREKRDVGLGIIARPGPAAPRLSRRTRRSCRQAVWYCSRDQANSCFESPAVSYGLRWWREPPLNAADLEGQQHRC